MHRAYVIACAAALTACFTNSDETASATAAATADATSSSTAGGETTTVGDETTGAETTTGPTTETTGADPICGDGKLDAGEDCDDGNQSNADGCLSDCTIATCGDGLIWLGVEDCDNGPDNDAKSLRGCRPDCQAAACGDGAIYPGDLGPAIPLATGSGQATADLNDRSARAVGIDALGQAYVVSDWNLGGGYVHTVAIERFAADGGALDEAPILAYQGPKGVRRPSLAAAPDGSFIVVWETDGSGEDVVYRRYDAAGLPLSEALPGATILSGDQKDPSVAINGDGAAVIAFRAISGPDSESKHVIRVRTIPAQGEPPADFVAGVAEGDLSVPSLAIRGDGSYVLAFTDKDGAVYARGYAPGGALAVALDAVPGILGAAANSHPWVGVAALEDGAFALAGMTADGHVTVNRYDSAGSLAHATIASPAPLGSIPRIDLAADSAGNLFALWAGCGLPGEDDSCEGDPVGVLLRRIYADGEALGDAAQIAMIDHFKPQALGVASDAIGDLAIVAQDDNDPFLWLAPAQCP